jgi:hypothetical protein
LSEASNVESGSERDATFLAQLETRRAEHAVAQWQAPGLTIAAQAFLLSVITNTDIPPYARAWILAAGVVATFAAGISLVRLHEREIRYAEAIAFYGQRVSTHDPRPYGLQGTPLAHKWWHPWAQADRVLRWLSSRLQWLWPNTYHWWLIALALFIAADIIAFLWTNEPPPVQPTGWTLGVPEMCQACQRSGGLERTRAEDRLPL